MPDVSRVCARCVTCVCPVCHVCVGVCGLCDRETEREEVCVIVCALSVTAGRHVCVCVCARACVRACVCACARVRMQCQFNRD